MISYGHRFLDIQEYTFEQIELFLRLGAELANEQRAILIADTATACQGDNKGIKAAIKRLS